MGTGSRVRASKELLTAWLLLLIDHGPSHGYELQRVLDAHDMSVEPASVYRALRRLETDGAITSAWMQPVAGPQRRCYHLTATGRRRLDEHSARLSATRDLHDAFLAAHRHRRGRGISGE